MAGRISAELDRSVIPRSPQPATRLSRWRLPHYLALLGIPLIVVEVWTFIAWLTDDPHQVTTGRPTGGSGVWVPRAYEIGSAVLAVPVLWYAVRKYRRERKLSFDHYMMIAGATTWWVDVTVNFYMPVFQYGTGWINLNYVQGYMPLWVNPSSKDMAWPIVANPLLYAFLVPAAAIVGCKGIEWMKTRWPNLTLLQIAGILFALGCVVDFAYEGPQYFANGYNFTGMPNEFALFGPKYRFPIIEILMGSIWFMLFAFLRYTKNDRGQSILERGMDNLSHRNRSGVTALAFYSTFTFMTAGLSLPHIVMGFYADPPEGKKPWGLYTCDGALVDGSVTSTPYGPCPGTIDYWMPKHQYPDPSLVPRLPRECFPPANGEAQRDCNRPAAAPA